MTTLTRLIRAGTAALALALFVVAVPWVLVTLIGNPWPDGGVSLSAPLTDEALLGILAVACWVLWAQLMLCITAETAAALRGSDIDLHLPGTLEVQRVLARRLVTAVLAVAVTGGSAVAAGSWQPTQAAASPVSAATHDPTSADGAGSGNTHQIRATNRTDEQRAPADRAHLLVQRGDSLWSLATAHLGDGDRWTEIAKLNNGHEMADGRRFQHGDPIRPGWDLRMPSDATGLEKANRRTTPHPDTVVVEPGDTLSSIAETELGHADRWPQLWRENRGRPQTDGSRLRDPDLIRPGWALDLPGDVYAPDPSDTPQHPEIRRPGPGPVAPTLPEQRPAPDPGSARGDALQGQPTAADETEARDTQASPDLPTWVMRGLTSSGALLAGALLLALRRRRAAQHRHRRPGRGLPPPPVELAYAEKSITIAGRSQFHTIEFVEQVTRRLVATLASGGSPLPSLAALEVTAEELRMHLHAPATAPEDSPWVSHDDLVWSVDLDVHLDEIGPPPGDNPAPWPLLVTVGHDEHDSAWLLNLEDQVVSVTGDPTAAADLARFVAAEIACNPWSRNTVLDLVGVAGEIVPISPDRIHEWDTVSTPAASAIAAAVHTIDRLADHGVDTPTARARQDDPDSWPSAMLILDEPSDSAELTQLLELVTTHRSRTATCVVLQGATDTDGLKLVVDQRGTLDVPALNLRLRSAGLTTSEAHGCAALLAQAEHTGDAPLANLAGDEPWQQLATATGSLRDQYRTPRDADTIEPSASLLESSDDAYLAVSATTAEDLGSLAPTVTARLRDRVAEADPDLDADLAAWAAPSCRRPRLTLLGPVAARTSGAALDKRKPYYTELLAYLATRPHGATPDEVATAFDITPARARTDINKLRSWLGTNENGQPYLPDARNAPAARERGIGVYQVVDALVDVDLFRRLRLRGETRGPDGMDDLATALQLVQGRPFDHLRPAGWAWLLEGDRLDEQMVCAISDIAHIVVTHSLCEQDLSRASTAVTVAMTAAPDEETCRLDLAAVLEAQGHAQQAMDVLRHDVYNRSDDGEPPTELSDRTEAVARSRQWLTDEAI